MATTLITPHPIDLELGTLRSSAAGEDSDEENCRRRSSSYSTPSCYLSECSVEDIESGGQGAAEMTAVESSKVGVNILKVERDCRICHLSLDECGYSLELGCSCKGDLASAHKLCADTWFKIRGNKTCEICGSMARNIVGVNEVEPMEPWNEANDAAPIPAVPPHPPETRHFWQGHKFLNFLLACMVFAFVISWLFHFNVPS